MPITIITCIMSAAIPIITCIPVPLCYSTLLSYGSIRGIPWKIQPTASAYGHERRGRDIMEDLRTTQQTNSIARRDPRSAAPFSAYDANATRALQNASSLGHALHQPPRPQDDPIIPDMDLRTATQDFHVSRRTTRRPLNNAHVNPRTLR